jgi:subfamily B ATP-binding cassette protein MsbA
MPEPAPNSVPEESPEAPIATARPPKPTFLDAIRKSNEGYKRLWPYVDKYRGRFIASIAAGAGSAVLTAAQAKVLQMVTHSAFREGVTDAAAKAAPVLGHVLLISSLLPVVIIARCLCDYMENFCMTSVTMRVLHDLRVQIFQHILGQSMSFFNREKIGSLISRVSNDTRSAQMAIGAVTDDIVTQPLTVVAVIVEMMRLDWRFTIYSLCIFPVCFIPIVFFGKKIREIGRQDETCNAELMVLLHEALAGIRLVKSLCREPYEEGRFNASSEHMVQVGIKVRNAMGIVGPLIEGMAALGIMLALVYVFFSHMPFSNFVALLGSLFLLYNPVKKLSKVHVNLQKALGATAKIFDLLARPASIQDEPDATVLKNVTGQIEFDAVTFTYDMKLPPALKRMTLMIPPGKTYALVGASGAGKSTVFSLLQRFYDPYRGVIRLDGQDIRKVTQESLRSNIGVVSQDTFLFNESILENIRYGRLDATDEEVYEAARNAYAHDFILKQPQGYKTEIGDKGCKISGGQQQRLAIARALLKNAPILLLDEATSALDSESEQEIQAALERLAVGRTVIAIAHRLSTILKADQIVVMEDGQIKEVGRHEELLEKSGLYRRLYDYQYKNHSGEAPVEPPPFEVVSALAS